MRAARALALALLGLAAVPPASAAEAPAGPTPTAATQELLASFDDAANKILDLARAIPAEKYGWRPGEGVRSISEALMHVAGGNYFILKFAGVTPPEGLSREMEKVGDKEKVVAELERSIAHVRQGVGGFGPGALDEQVEFFQGPASRRQVLLLVVSHAHEHLGQLIAYARMNGVAPPWSGSDGG